MIRMRTPRAAFLSSSDNISSSATLRIVDVEADARPADEPVQPRSRVLGADDQIADARRVVGAVGVGIEQPLQFLDDTARLRHDTEAAALKILSAVKLKPRM